MSRNQLQNSTHVLESYLSRSGALPVAIECSLELETWEEGHRDLIQSTFRVLTNACHRWKTVGLRLPVNLLDQLLPIRGKLAALEKLEYDTPWSAVQPNLGVFYVRCFSEAPVLCDVRFNTHMTETGTTVDLNLPWSQLHSFQNHSHRDPGYKRLVETQPITLRSLSVAYDEAGAASALPSTLSILPNLVKFAYQHTDCGEAVFAPHFDFLVLPSLTHLFISRGPLVHSSSLLAEKTLSLIIRSACSLQHLSLHFADTQWHTLHKILSLSPEIAYLDISHTKPEGLRQLILDPNSTRPILPKLKNLTINHIIRQGLDGVDAGVIDGVAIMEVVQSRTIALEDGMANAHHLEDVHLLGYDVDKFHTDLTRFESTELGAAQSDPEMDALAARFLDILEEKFGSYESMFGEYSEEDLNNPELHSELDGYMRELEEAGLTAKNTQVLIRKNIPCWLKDTREAFDDVIPGDELLNFRRRAGHLLEKWKPLLLRDAQVSPFYWKYLSRYGAGYPLLKYLPDSRDEGEIWSKIIEYGYDE